VSRLASRQASVVGRAANHKDFFESPLAAAQIPHDLAQFIRAEIHSVSQLEVLLLLRDRGGDWTPEAAAGELRIAVDFARSTLIAFRASGLVSVEERFGSYRYAPITPELGSLMDLLAEYYSTTRYTIINQIYEVPDGPAQDLAKAFRIRKKSHE
jgi:hypothetical protein